MRPFVLAAILVATLAPAAFASEETERHHVVGDIELAGAPAEGTRIRLSQDDGAVELLTFAFGDPAAATSVGTAGLVAKTSPDGDPVEGWLSYWMDLPEGAYRIDVVSGEWSEATGFVAAHDPDDAPPYTVRLHPLTLRGPDDEPGGAPPPKEDRGYRVTGDVRLNGAPLDELRLEVFNHSRTYEHVTMYVEGPTFTPLGELGIAAKRDETGALVPGMAEYWIDTDSGFYVFVNTSGYRGKAVFSPQASHTGTPTEFAHGVYRPASLPLISLAPAWANEGDLYDYSCSDATAADPIACYHTEDVDGDGLATYDEKLLGSDPHDADTDDDGVSDGEDPFPLDPARSEGFDYTCPGTGMTQAECDAHDADGDDVTTAGERAQRTDPNDPDTDDDGYGDSTGDDKEPLNPAVNKAGSHQAIAVVIGFLAATLIAGPRRRT